MRNVWFGVLCSVPATVVCSPSDIAVVMTGKFCRLLTPVSASSGSFRVTPLAGSPVAIRLMPIRPLENIELPRIELPGSAVFGQPRRQVY